MVVEHSFHCSSDTMSWVSIYPNAVCEWRWLIGDLHFCLLCEIKKSFEINYFLSKAINITLAVERDVKSQHLSFLKAMGHIYIPVYIIKGTMY